MSLRLLPPTLSLLLHHSKSTLGSPGNLAKMRRAGGGGMEREVESVKRGYNVKKGR